MTVAYGCENAHMNAPTPTPTVRLVDLEVIKRFSLAVRQDSAPAADVLEALDASRALVLKAMAKRAPAGRTRKATKKATRATKAAK